MKAKSPYRDILGLVNGLVILFLITGKRPLLYASVALAILALVWRQWALWTGEVLTRIMDTLGTLLNAIILTVVYILLLTPISFLYRIFRRKASSQQDQTTFTTMTKTTDADSFTRQW